MTKPLHIICTAWFLPSYKIMINIKREKEQPSQKVIATTLQELMGIDDWSVWRKGTDRGEREKRCPAKDFGRVENHQVCDLGYIQAHPILAFRWHTCQSLHLGRRALHFARTSWFPSSGCSPRGPRLPLLLCFPFSFLLLEFACNSQWENRLIIYSWRERGEKMGHMGHIEMGLS